MCFGNLMDDVLDSPFLLFARLCGRENVVSFCGRAEYFLFGPVYDISSDGYVKFDFYGFERCAVFIRNVNVPDSSAL